MEVASVTDSGVDVLCHVYASGRLTRQDLSVLEFDDGIDVSATIPLTEALNGGDDDA